MLLQNCTHAHITYMTYVNINKSKLSITKVIIILIHHVQDGLLKTTLNMISLIWPYFNKS